MPVLWIAGLGPGELRMLTTDTLLAIGQAEKVILRTKAHPAAAAVSELRGDAVFCDDFYEAGGSFRQVYEAIVDHVYAEALSCGSVCYCVPGHPLVAEETVRLLLARAAGAADGAGRSGTESPFAADEAAAAPVEIRVLPAVSFLDAAFVALGIDPIQERLTILDAASIWGDENNNGGNDGGEGNGDADDAGDSSNGNVGDRAGWMPLPKGSCLFAQVYDRMVAGELKLALLEEAPPEAEVKILHRTGIKGEEELILCPLAELDHFKGFDHLTSVYLPYIGSGGAVQRLPDAPPAASYPLDGLVEVLRRLLGPGGCPWDQAQTHETLKPYLLEEANEALEAIDEKDMDHLKEELGDVLMQVVFHCALAEARGDFDINGVIDGITEKMIRRHPHVFGDEKAENPEEVMVLWKKIKEKEKESRGIIPDKG
ncbi:MAG: MazG family protein [Clostridiales bacterium]|nr:MazG family protein [Clostridiales bacterium]